MGSHRAHIVLPEELISAIDALVGARGRSSFLVETARAEIERRRLLEFLQSDEPAWLEANHPELKQGAGPWVRKMRQESQRRVVEAHRPGRSKRER